MGVQGIGGIFFRARDPDALGAWYREHLGIGGGCTADGAAPAGPWEWSTLGGPVVFQPFKESTDYWSADRQWMMNLRVAGIGAMLDALRAAGIEIETRAEWDEAGIGRFARLHDPEGNAIELWEPPAD